MDPEEFVEFLKSKPSAQEVAERLQGYGELLANPDVGAYFRNEPRALAAVLSRELHYADAVILAAADVGEALGPMLPSTPPTPYCVLPWFRAKVLTAPDSLEADVLELLLTRQSFQARGVQALAVEYWLSQIPTRRADVFREVNAEKLSVCSTIGAMLQTAEDAHAIWGSVLPFLSNDYNAGIALGALRAVAKRAPGLLIETLPSRPGKVRSILANALAHSPAPEAVEWTWGHLSSVPDDPMRRAFRTNHSLREKICADAPKGKANTLVRNDLIALWARRPPQVEQLDSVCDVDPARLFRDCVSGRHRSKDYFRTFADDDWASLVALVDHRTTAHARLEADDAAAAWAVLKDKKRSAVEEVALAVLAPIAVFDEPSWATHMTDLGWDILGDRATWSMSGFGRLLTNRPVGEHSEERSLTNFQEAPARAAPWLVEALRRKKGFPFKTATQMLATMGEPAVAALVARADLVSYAGVIAPFVHTSLPDPRLREPLETVLATKPAKKIRTALEAAIEAL